MCDQKLCTSEYLQDHSFHAFLGVFIQLMETVYVVACSHVTHVTVLFIAHCTCQVTPRKEKMRIEYEGIEPKEKKWAQQKGNKKKKEIPNPN